MSNTQKVMDFVSEKWDREIVPQLSTYIKIPNKSPMFDPAWRANGHMDRAVELLASLLANTTGYQTYDASELTRWNEWPIYTQTYDEIDMSTL